MTTKYLHFLYVVLELLLCNTASFAQAIPVTLKTPVRQRISLNQGWRFMRYLKKPDHLLYDVRPEVTDRNDNVVADTKSTEGLKVASSDKVLKGGALMPQANNEITFEISEAGEIVATDNGDPADLVAFPSKQRRAYGGLVLVIVRGKKGVSGEIIMTAKSPGIAPAQIFANAR